jgi:polysaccharide export outer membrane protein
VRTILPSSRSAFRALVLGIAVASALGCRPKHPYVWFSELPDQSTPIEDIPLRPGDELAVQVAQIEELAKPTEIPFKVNADGNVVLPIVGVLKVQGLTPSQAVAQLNRRLQGIVVNPTARISVVNPRKPLITVVGEVRTPGQVDIPYGEGVLPALARAGGLTEFADPKHIYVVRKYPKLMRIRFTYSDLTGGVGRALQFELRDGDVIVVE